MNDCENCPMNFNGPQECHGCASTDGDGCLLAVVVFFILLGIAGLVAHSIAG